MTALTLWVVERPWLAVPNVTFCVEALALVLGCRLGVCA